MWILPAATLNVNNYSNIEANASKPGDFFQKIILREFNVTYSSPRDLTFPWRPYFDRRDFQNFHLPYFKIKQKLS